MRALLSLGLVLAASCGFAASRYYNIKVDGSYDGEWGDSRHWGDATRKHTGEVGGKGDNVYMLDGISACISLESDYSVNYFQLNPGTGTVTLAGDCSLTETGGTWEHVNGAKRVLKIAGGATYNATSAAQFTSEGTIVVSENGTMKVKAYNAGVMTQVEGGLFQCTDLKLDTAGDSIEVTGGELEQTSTTAISTSSGSLVVLSGGKLTTAGGISFANGASMTVTGGTVANSKTLTFNAGSALTVSGCTVNLGTISMADGSTLTLGPDAVLQISPSSSIKCRTINADSTARIEIVIPEGATASRKCPILLPPGVSAEDLSVTLSGAATGWSFQHVGNMVFITGGVSTTATEPYEWIGAIDGNWSTPGNWFGGAAPVAGASIYLSGETQAVMTNDFTDSRTFARIFIRSGSAPFLIRGNPVRLNVTATGWNSNHAIRSESGFPVVFEAKVVYAQSPQMAFFATKDKGYLAFLGGLTSSYPLYAVSGTVYLGGVCGAKNFIQTYAQDLHLLDGCTFSISAQADNLTAKGPIEIAEGATLTVGGTYFRMSNTSSRFNGTVNVNAPLYANQTFNGTGTVNLNGGFYGTAASAVTLAGGGMTLKAPTWDTLSTEGLARTLTVSAGNAMLAVDGDFTYGPADPAITTETTAADRALRVESGATLTVAVAENAAFTLVDPIAGDGSVAFTGAGTVGLETDASAIGGTLSFDGTVQGVLPEAFCADQRTVFTAKAVTGLPVSARQKFGTRALEAAVELYGKLRTGLMLLFK